MDEWLELYLGLLPVHFSWDRQCTQNMNMNSVFSEKINQGSRVGVTKNWELYVGDRSFSGDARAQLTCGRSTGIRKEQGGRHPDEQ